MENKEYWTCTIGPIKRNKIPFGGDSKPRQSVRKALGEMTGDFNLNCSSGWGLKEDMKELLDIIKLLPTTNPKLFNKIKKLVEERNLNN